MAASPAQAAPQQNMSPRRDDAPVTPVRQKPAIPSPASILQQQNPSARTAAQAVAPEDEDAITTNSDREYAVLTLPNGLEVFLTYDPSTRISAASMSVGTGGLYDPADKPGLSHFLEHMLFLGTEKYPKIGSYQEYLDQNGGEYNAMTGPRNTTYFFGIPNDNFEGALDRFSEFFKHPLLDPAYSAKEVNAVNNEFAKNKLSDGRRANYIKDLLSNPGHPLANFGTGGNLQTLAGDNTEALKAFYNKYYSATNMKLAFISDLPLEQQAALVKKYFATVPSFAVDKPQISSDFRSPLQDQYRLLQVKALNDVRVMTLEFPTIRLVDHRDSKPESILSQILGYEGRGSLLSKLKSEGLATSLSAGGDYYDPSVNTMNMSIGLTQRGLENKQRVLEVVFAYIDMLKAQGVQEHTFQDQKTMGRAGIHWEKPASGTDYVTSMSELMFDYKPKDLATLPFLVSKFDPAAYRAVLETMTPNNMLVTVLAKNVPTNKTAPYYDAEYSYEQVGGDAYQRLAHPPAVDGISYPAPNPYIPRNLELVNEKPHLLANDNNAKIYAQFDHQYGVPKAYMSLQLETPKVYDSVRDYAKALLWQTCLAEGIDEDVYPMQEAGLTYDVSVNKKGVAVQFGGYTPRINDIAKLVGDNLTACRITESKLADLKDAVIRGLKNDENGSAAGEAFEAFGQAMEKKKDYAPDQIARELRSLNLDDVQDFARQFLRETVITGTAYGNWNDADARTALTAALEGVHTRPGRPIPQPEEPKPLVKGERSILSIQVPDNNNALLYVIQTDRAEDLKRNAAVQMIAKILQTDFYTQMRTEQQLGYIVQNDGGRIDKSHLALTFLIQSGDYGPAELNKRVETWLQTAVAAFDNMSDEDFLTFKIGTAQGYMGAPTEMLRKQQQLFSIATSKDNPEFDGQMKMLKAFKELTKADLAAVAHELLDGREAARTIVEVRSRNSTEAVPEGAYTSVDTFKHRAAPAPRF